MAHNIAKIEGEEAFAYFGERPWHQLGTEVPGLLTTREAMVAGRLDWTVKLVPLLLDDRADEEGFSLPSMIRVPDRFATVRVTEDGSMVPLGVVGSRYEPIQNVEAFEFFDSALGEGSACIETVGALGRGERIFALARVPDLMEITRGDPVEQYILLHTSHDGSSPLEAMFTNVRVVCQNTLQAAVRGAQSTIRIRHTRSAAGWIKEAHRVLCASQAYWGKLQEVYTEMASRDLSRLDVQTFLRDMFPGKMVQDKVTGRDVEQVSGKTRSAREKVEALFDGNALGSDEAGMTAWGLYNATAQYIDHERPLRADTNRWEAAQFGSGVHLRQRAFNLLVGAAG